VDEGIFGGGDRMNEDFNNWDEIAEKFEKATGQVVRKAAFDIVAGYQARCHVDTGFMKNSAYVVTDKESTYGQATPTKKGAYLLPEVEKPEDGHTAYAAIGANYAYIEEFGGVNHPAHPALVPAVEAVRPSFEAALGQIEDKLKEVRG
jgi:hypothetical protein